MNGALDSNPHVSDDHEAVRETTVVSRYRESSIHTHGRLDERTSVAMQMELVEQRAGR